MAECNEIVKLDEISAEVDEYQFEVILTIQCIKANDYLLKKFHQQLKYRKQALNFMNNANLKLETELNLDKRQIQTLLNALETTNSANVQIQKEILLAKETKIHIFEKVNKRIEKYESLWLAHKKQYESILFNQIYLQTKKKHSLLQEHIKKLFTEKQKLQNDIIERKNELFTLDKINIIKLAEYIIYERPIIVQKIKEKLSKSKKSSKVINNIETSAPKSINTNVIEDSWHISMHIDNELPKLQLNNNDLDIKILSHKLDQLKKFESQNISLPRANLKQISVDNNYTKNIKPYDITKDVYVSTYFQTNYNEETFDLKTNYSKSKLIRIIEDVKVDKCQAHDIVSKAKGSLLQSVSVIKEDTQKEKTKKVSEMNDKQAVTEIEEIEVIDLVKNQIPNILLPPTQFLDVTQNELNRNSQGKVELQTVNTNHNSCNNYKSGSQEKRVKFDKVVSVRCSDTDLEKYPENDNVEHQLNMSATSDDSYKKIKESVFKKHNLDLSPQFMYSKNHGTPMKIEKNIVTSKFFNSKNIAEQNKVQIIDIDDDTVAETVASVQNIEDKEKTHGTEAITHNKTIKETQKNMPTSGLLLNYNSQGITDSLNLSVSTMDYEDADGEFPNFIDSSLLMSPKAEDHMPTISNTLDQEEPPQERPNFLSGFKKIGFPFFNNTSTQNKPETSAQNQNSNFTFSFGGDEKTGRGSLFNMFH